MFPYKVIHYFLKLLSFFENFIVLPNIDEDVWMENVLKFYNNIKKNKKYFEL